MLAVAGVWDVFADHLGPHLGEVASDEVTVPLDLQLGDLSPAALLAGGR